MAPTQSEVLQSHLEKIEKNVQIKTENGKTINKRKSLHEKVFKAQNSLLTDLFQIPHIKTIYNIFVTGLLIFFLQAVISDVINTGRINLGFEHIKWNFGQISYALLIWTIMVISLHVLYVAYIFWALHRIHLSPKDAQIWDQIFLAGYILYEIMLFVIPARETYINKFPTTTSLILICEQIRLVMKSHAFVRSNLSRVVNIKAKTEDNTNVLNIPTYKNFIYFLFAPTLIYRDSYPRTDHINWKFVTLRLLEVVGIIFYINFLFEVSLIPLYKDFGKKPMPIDQLVKSVFSSMTPCMVIFLCGFYVLLHAWLNATAELLRFADRGFYKEWWLSTHYAEYYSKWNCVVHDWLFAYVYKEFDAYLGPQKRYFSLFIVFLVSALFHEYLLALAFGFFYPFLFIVFGVFGVALVFLPRKAGGNIFLWLLLYTGVGIVTSAYLIEYYARINCQPITDSALFNFFLPRSWWCKIN